MKKIVFVAHLADRSGAPIALLRTLQWLGANASLEFEVLLLHGGELEPEFRTLAPVHVVEPSLIRTLNPLRRLSNRLRLSAPARWLRLRRARARLEREDVGLVFFNSVATAKFFEDIGELRAPIVGWVHECRHLAESFGIEQVRALCRRATALYAVSNATARSLRMLDSTLSDRIQLLPGFVFAQSRHAAGAAATLRESLGIPRDAVVIGGAGKLGWLKGTDLFLQLAAAVDSRDSECRLRFLWFGSEAEGGERSRLQHDMDALGIGGRIHFAGATEAPGAFFEAFDLFALTSREDAFPLVCLEAAQHRTPIVCFEGAGGMAEFVAKEAGRVVPYLDVSEMAEAVLSLAVQPDERARLGEAASRRIQRDFHADVVVPRLLEYIGEALGSESQRGEFQPVRVGAQARLAPAKRDAPSVGTVREGAERPYWSVMIPTFQPTQMLEAALRSVLDQDPGPDRMQIAIVDDGSTNDFAVDLIERLAPERIEYYGQTANRGLAKNWNACLDWSRGYWIHLLHQDDILLPGFYEAMEQAGSGPYEVGVGFCRSFYMNADGHWEGMSPLERSGAGVLENWQARVTDGQRIQCPSVVVRREVYEELGGFRPELRYALDWEMWMRAASRWSFWYEPRLLAAYRKMPGNETSRMLRTGESVRDSYRAVRVASESFPEPLRPQLLARARRACARSALCQARNLWFEGDRKSALAQVRAAAHEDRSLGFWLGLAYNALPCIAYALAPWLARARGASQQWTEGG